MLSQLSYRPTQPILGRDRGRVKADCRAFVKAARRLGRLASSNVARSSASPGRSAA
jgi:hypothetical protein